MEQQDTLKPLEHRTFLVIALCITGFQVRIVRGVLVYLNHFRCFFVIIIMHAGELVEENIPTGSDKLDSILGCGGIKTKVITEIVGAPGAGKTQLGLQLAVCKQSYSPKVSLMNLSF